MGMIIGSMTVEDDIFRVIIKYKLDTTWKYIHDKTLTV